MPTNPNEEREDSKGNRAKIRTALLRFVKKQLRKPTKQELVELTGFSAKTVKRHLRRLTLGTGQPNPYQVLTHDVVLAIHARAVGYEHPAVKILAVSQGKGEPSEIEKVPYTEHYPPDAASAKLWMQLVEGFSEKTEQQHSGAVGFTFNLIAPAPAPDDAGH